MQLTASLNSPNLQAKKIVFEMLAGIAMSDHGQTATLVLEGLEQLSTSNGEPASSYAYWFKSFESVLSGRGKMGTRVGASEEVKKIAGQDASLNEFAVRLSEAHTLRVSDSVQGCKSSSHCCYPESTE